MKFGPFGRGLRPVTEEQEAEFAKNMKEADVGIKDGFAMVAAAFITIVLPCLLILGIIVLVTMAVFGAFR